MEKMLDFDIKISKAFLTNLCVCVCPVFVCVCVCVRVSGVSVCVCVFLFFYPGEDFNLNTHRLVGTRVTVGT